ncbi:hypothetical protein [Acidovorax carolinensis]|uniref:hypothetical protein n=1 Tax=Acidovorax carolinensis TaxID=553814 RepID=UPI0012FF7E10|nr:hypothetical protein [Acidovorax carolinensis]
MRVEITAIVEVPDGTPIDAIEEWVEFELGTKGAMSSDNPLAGESMACIRVDISQR